MQGSDIGEGDEIDVSQQWACEYGQGKAEWPWPGRAVLPTLVERPCDTVGMRRLSGMPRCRAPVNPGAGATHGAAIPRVITRLQRQRSGVVLAGTNGCVASRSLAWIAGEPVAATVPDDCQTMSTRLPAWIAATTNVSIVTQTVSQRDAIYAHANDLI